MPKILLVDDDPQALESTQKILLLAGYEVLTAGDGQAALELIRKARDTADVDLVLTDVRMPKLGGLEFLRALSLCGDRTPVILMTAFGRIEDAVWAMKLGAVDFLTKPFKRQALLASLETALKRARLQKPAIASGLQGEASVEGRRALDTLVGRSPAMMNLRRMIEQVAVTSASVLLSGESGTGKELVARCIHQSSARAKRPFVALNCAAVPEQLIEAELFGVEKGSYTGATSARNGIFESADGGTLLLDEIGDMPLPLQAKLLRALQEGEIRRVGANVSRKIDVRLIAASHRDLREGVRLGTFREDLLYRLEVVQLEVPSLRDRREDVPELAYHFLRAAGERHDRKLQGIGETAMEILLAHRWPGNVRELSNVIERAIVFARGPEIVPEDLPPHLVALAGAPPTPRHGLGAASGASYTSGASYNGSTISVPLGTPLKDVEELLIMKTLEATSGDKNMTAKLLGINSRTIYRKLDKKAETPAAE